jgi:hypothetical protein
MRRDNGQQRRRSGVSSASQGARTRPSSSPAVESLEDRQLLSIYLGPTKSRPLFSGHAFYHITLTGPGFQTVSSLGSGIHRIIGINLTGTTSQSQLNITLQSTRSGFGTQNTALRIGRITVQSGQLGAINAASTANLIGAITPLKGGIQTFAFNSLSKNAQVNVLGDVGTFQVGSADLSANGLVHIGGGVTGQFNVGSLHVDGGKVLIDHSAAGLSLGALRVEHSGQFLIGGDVTGTSSLGAVDLNGGRFLISHDVASGAAVTAGSLTIENAGQFVVGNNLNSVLQVAGSEKILSNGIFQVGKSLGGLSVGQDLTLDSGRLLVGQDVLGPITVASGINLSHNASLSVTRDVVGAMNVTGDVRLDSGGSLSVGRNLNTVSINGDLAFTPSAGTINVGGNVAGLTINGVYRGRSNLNPSTPEFSVGLNLTNFTVLGGTASQGGVQNANISVGKDLVGLNVPHGIFNSLITAGVLIDGAPQNGSAGGNVGADAFDAIFDSQLLAGVQIKDLLINGDVRSDFVTNPNPTGIPTRIVAGEDRQGNFTGGGNIDNFQITGALIDAVLAASVQPYGGDGTLPPTGYNANRAPAANPGVFSNYNAPAGTITGGTFAAPIVYPNYGYVSYVNEVRSGTTAFNRAIDPDIHVNILPGAINPSFASTPAPSSVTSTITSGSSSNSTSNATNQGNSTSQGLSSNTGQSLTTTTTVTTTNQALPIKSTVLGGVISNSHDGTPDAFDFAGIYAADTSGVFVGPVPKASAGTSG